MVKIYTQFKDKFTPKYVKIVFLETKKILKTENNPSQLASDILTYRGVFEKTSEFFQNDTNIKHKVRFVVNRTSNIRPIIHPQYLV